MAYLTPDSIPEGDDCRPLFIPAGSDWLALFGGALTELTKPWNWEQFGALTVEQTVEKMSEIVAAWYDTLCCELPDGGKIIRIGGSGHIEQLENNEWVEPTGDYIIPAPEARTGGTEADQICLASKNAVNVLQALYEDLSDSFGESLTEAAALVELIGLMTLVIGFEFAPITYGIYALAAWAFGLLYSGLSYLTADLWDDSFTAQMTCFLVACATNTAGVVTFDWQCFNDKLNSLADDFDLSEIQIRLYLQVAFLLQFIGGVDGLNLAGGTTEISDDNCEDCSDRWCRIFDFTVDDGGFAIFDGETALYDTGVGWKDDLLFAGEYYRLCSIARELPVTGDTVIDFIQVIYDFEGGASPLDTFIYVDTEAIGGRVAIETPYDGVDLNIFTSSISINDTHTIGVNVCTGHSGVGDPGGSLLIKSFAFHGSGAPPEWGEHCSE